MTIKHKIARTVFASQLTRSLIDRARPLSSGLYIFLWHDVTDQPSEFMRESQMFSTSSEFVEQIQFISEHFNLISPEELIAATRNSFETDQRYALISFDDAWLGIFNATQEILKPWGIKPIIFTNYGTIESRIDFSAYRRFASKVTPLNEGVSEYREFVETFMVSLDEIKANASFQAYQGEIMTKSHLHTLEALESAYISNHLYHHFDCGKIDLSTFISEFEKNREELKSFSNFLDFFAFPYGDPDSNSKLEMTRYIHQLEVPYFWANLKWNSIESTLEKSFYGRIGIQRENRTDFWIKIRRSSKLDEKNRA